MSSDVHYLAFNIDYNVDKKAKKNKDQRISVCIDCMLGIFPQHEHVFTSRGLVHTECINAITKIT